MLSPESAYRQYVVAKTEENTTLFLSPRKIFKFLKPIGETWHELLFIEVAFCRKMKKM